LTPTPHYVSPCEECGESGGDVPIVFPLREILEKVFGIPKKIIGNFRPRDTAGP